MLIRYDELKDRDIIPLDEEVNVIVSILECEEMEEDTIYIGWAAASEEDYRILEERHKERVKSNKEEKYAIFQFGSFIAKRAETVELIKREG